MVCCPVVVSIPRSGFCSFKRRWRSGGGRHSSVSIPRSGFCSFKQHPNAMAMTAMRMFQSLGRDSVHSSSSWDLVKTRVLPFQSLGRDSVHSSLTWRAILLLAVGRFNPSVGILFIQAFKPTYYCETRPRFQSLGRDSVHSSMVDGGGYGQLGNVSIPRSGFCSFKHLYIASSSAFILGFNPSVGILFIQA